MGHTWIGPAGSSNAGVPWPPGIPGQSASAGPFIKSLTLDTGSSLAGLKHWVWTNYGLVATDENGIFICESLRLVIIYGTPNVTEVPKLQHKCRVIRLPHSDHRMTLYQFLSYVNTIMVYQDNKELPIPARKYDSVGFDLYSTEDAVIAPGETKDVPTGVYCSFPVHIWGLLVARSSTFKKSLMANTAIIDPGFQGHLFAACHNRGTEDFHVKKGDRLIQLIPIADPIGISMQQAQSLDEFPDTERGSKGFGSTGT